MNTQSGDIKIRLAAAADFEAIFSIWLEGIHNSFDEEETENTAYCEKFRANFEQRQGIFNFWVAVDTENRICGWQSLIRSSNNPFRENAMAESSTYLSKANRFKGLGKLLLAYVLREAEKSGLEYVIGFVSAGNKAALKITKETGWMELGPLPPSPSGINKRSKLFMVRPV